MGIMSSTPQQNGFHAKRAKLYNSKVTVVLGKWHFNADFHLCNGVYCGKFPTIFGHVPGTRDNIIDAYSSFLFLSLGDSSSIRRSTMGRRRQRQSRRHAGHRCRCCLQMSSEWINGNRYLIVYRVRSARICTRARRYTCTHIARRRHRS